MTFLELCKATRKECGIQGEGLPSSVLTQTGLIRRVVDWVADADIYIQTLHPDWNFLWATHTVNTIVGSEVLVRPCDIGIWDITSFAIDRGTIDGRSIFTTSYEEWRSYNGLKENSAPYSLSIMPNKNLALSLPPDDVYEIYGEYWSAPVKLIADSQEPVYPERYQRLIIAKAKMWFFEDIESTDQWEQARQEFDMWLEFLESAELPNNQILGQNSPSPIIVRSV
jgi:hypothetical protein